MSKPMAVLAVLLVVQLFVGADKYSLSPIYAQARPRVSIIGHRGAAGLAPENTLAAFEKACEVGVNAIELDVHLTADGNIVVHHDYTLTPEIARTADGQWLDRPGPAIKDSTLAQLKTYDVGRLKPDTRYARRYPDQLPADGERIPTLGEVIALVNRKCSEATQLWVEIKTNPEKPGLTLPPEKIAGVLVARLRKQNYSPRTRILSFDWRVLVQVQKIAPEIATVYLSHAGSRLNTIKAGQPGSSPWLAGLDIDDFNGSVPRAVKAAGGKCWSPHYKYITYALLEEAHKLGLGVYVWTVDSRSEMVRLIEMGVDGITTNRPDLLKTVLESP